jgi:prepilin-type N-terminal cleavage/methylation domain-containing protein
MNRKSGFTLIELLVVIAIIAILAGITFPVFVRAKDAAYRSSDITNMNSIRTALQLYRTDQGAYPPALLGYVTLYDSGPNAGNVIPANEVQGALYPRRIDSLTTLRPALNRPTTGDFNKLFSTAVWPTNVGRTGQAGTAGQRYAYPTDNLAVARAVRRGDGTCEVVDNQYYRVSGYDAAPVRDSNGERMELRYTLFWSGYAVPADPCNPTANESGNASDTTRQLGYTDPPDTTVVTWNSFFREYNNGVLSRGGKRDLVLFLAGSARPFDSVTVAERAWQVEP